MSACPYSAVSGQLVAVSFPIRPSKAVQLCDRPGKLVSRPDEMMLVQPPIVASCVPRHSAATRPILSPRWRRLFPVGRLLVAFFAIAIRGVVFDGICTLLILAIDGRSGNTAFGLFCSNSNCCFLLRDLNAQCARAVTGFRFRTEAVLLLSSLRPVFSRNWPTCHVGSRFEGSHWHQHRSGSVYGIPVGLPRSPIGPTNLGDRCPGCS